MAFNFIYPEIQSRIDKIKGLKFMAFKPDNRADVLESETINQRKVFRSIVGEFTKPNKESRDTNRTPPQNYEL